MTTKRKACLTVAQTVVMQKAVDCLASHLAKVQEVDARTVAAQLRAFAALIDAEVQR